MVNPRGRVYTHSFDEDSWEVSYELVKSHSSSTKKKMGKEFMYEDCLHRRRFKTRFEICKNADKEFTDIRAFRRHSAETIIPSRLTNYAMFLHKRRATRKSESHKKRVTHTQKGVHNTLYTYIYIYMEGGYSYFAVVCGSSTR